MKFDFDDILLTPWILSAVNSRKDVNPFDERGMLPIMTAPMDTVVNTSNASTFYKNKIYSILPRDKYISVLNGWNGWNVWQAVGLDDFIEKFLDRDYFHLEEETRTEYILIDIANGHMKKLYDTAKAAKEKYGDELCLMVGNIANPKTFQLYAEIGIDYVRLGIGGGNACLTSVQTGVGYPMASLIKECAEIKESLGFNTKIVADGGFKKFADINKALALGADVIMLGSMLNKCLESAAITYRCSFRSQKDDPINFSTFDESQTMFLLNEGMLFKEYKGMSTKDVQKAWGRETLKTAEGISKYQKVEYTLASFVENLEDYLRSAMSYTGSKNLEEFRQSEFEMITPASFKRFDK